MEETFSFKKNPKVENVKSILGILESHIQEERKG